VAWPDWQPVAFSEIEPFPCAVLRHHYPTVPNWGDMEKFKEWPDAAIDVLVGGTPCQSFSVAGLRAGLADPRGNLALVYLAIAERYRPEWLVWENVPGVLSADGGRAFGAFLGGLAVLGYGFAYRVLDAQYAGLAQRRKRVFVVGHLGDWRRAAAVLFESASLRGDLAPRREAGERPTARPAVGATFGCDGIGAYSSSSSTLLKTGDDLGPGCEALVIPEVVGALTDGAHNGGGSTGKTPTPAASLPSVAMCLNAGGMGRLDSETETLIPVAFDLAQITSKANRTRVEAGLPASTLNVAGQMHAATATQVRRLTVEECEFLQGFPRGYTAVPYRNKPAADGPRYKALGNSMAVPCMVWLGQRIQVVNQIGKGQDAKND